MEFFFKNLWVLGKSVFYKTILEFVAIKICEDRSTTMIIVYNIHIYNTYNTYNIHILLNFVNFNVKVLVDFF